MSDSNFYRYYECNLQAPKIKAGELRSSQMSIAQLDATQLCSQPGGVCIFSGTSALGTTHTITSTELPLLANRQVSGTLTFFLSATPYINTSMGAFTKTNNTVVQALIYQRIGNMTSVNLTTNGANLVLTVSPAAECKWIFMGI